MKILFYNHTAKVSGAERVLLLILSLLDAREFRAVVMCPAGELQTLVEGQNVPCVVTENLVARFTYHPALLWQYLRSFARVIRTVRAQVKAAAPDVIHANSIRAGLVMTFATLGLSVPVVWHLHDLLPHHPISTAIRCCVSLSARVRLLAVSQATENRFRGWLLRPFRQRVPSTVLRNCADTERFQPDETSRQRIRTELGLPATAFVIGIIGQITARKGQLGLLNAFAKVQERIPTAVLLIVGEPLFTAADQEYWQLLQQQTQTLGLAAKVHLLGARRDVPAVMQTLDLLVVNSLEEPCGLVVLEGMASAIPVLATRVGGTPEMIQHGSHGWLVSSQREDELATAIGQLQTDPTLRARLADAARERVSTQFSIASYQQAVVQFYREMQPQSCTGRQRQPQAITEGSER
ncbi:MAG: glycosyltransferase family 4 protein [Blastocatellia bacterium]